MSTWAYMGGAAGLLIMGQQSGAALLDQALQNDLSVKTVMTEAGNLAGLGVNATDAAIIVAGAGLGYKVLQIVEKIAPQFFETINMRWREKNLPQRNDDGGPHAPPRH